VVDAPVLLKKWQVKDGLGLMEYCMLQQMHPLEPYGGLENPSVDVTRANLGFLNEAEAQQHLQFLSKLTPKLYGVYRSVPGSHTFRRLEEAEFAEAVKQATVGSSGHSQHDCDALWIGMTNANMVAAPPGHEIVKINGKPARATLDLKLGTHTCDPKLPNAKKRYMHGTVDRLSTSRELGVCVISGKWLDSDRSLDSLDIDELPTSVIELDKHQAKFVGRNLKKPTEWGERGLKKVLKAFLLSEDLRADFLKHILQVREWSHLSEEKQPPFTLIGSSILLNYTVVACGSQFKAHLSCTLIDFAHVLPTRGNEVVLAGYRTGTDTLVRLGQKLWRDCPNELEENTRSTVSSFFSPDLPQHPYPSKRPRATGPTLLTSAARERGARTHATEEKAILFTKAAEEETISDFEVLVKQFRQSPCAANAALQQDLPEGIRTIIRRAVVYANHGNAMNQTLQPQQCPFFTTV
jgi:hypothetical protein